MFVGTAGTGKTTAAKILIKHIDCDSMVLNASDDNNIETVRSKIRTFASTAGWANIKIMVLDEFDGFSRQGQEALKNLMEQFSLHCRFILTANNQSRVIDPIISRCQVYNVVPPSKKEVAVHLAGILKTEGVTFTTKDVKFLLDAYYPDIRKVIHEAQACVANNVLAVDEKQLLDADFKLKVIEGLTLKSARKTKLDTIRQLVVDAGIRDFAPLYRFLYDRLDDYTTPASVSFVILAIADGQFQDGQVVDKEINFMATIIKIMDALA